MQALLKQNDIALPNSTSAKTIEPEKTPINPKEEANNDSIDSQEESDIDRQSFDNRESVASSVMQGMSTTERNEYENLGLFGQIAFVEKKAIDNSLNIS